MVFIAWFFYGGLGGFIVLTVLGGIAGHYAGRKSIYPDDKNKKIILFSFCSGLLSVFIISILDYFIGQW